MQSKLACYAERENFRLKGKKILNWVMAATLVCGTSIFTSCSSDNDDTVTGIYSHVASPDLGNTYYTTSGQNLTHRPTAKGIYIRGGKKVVIK